MVTLAGGRPDRAGIPHSVTTASSRPPRGSGKGITSGAAGPVRQGFLRAGKLHMTTGRFSGFRFCAELFFSNVHFGLSSLGISG